MTTAQLPLLGRTLEALRQHCLAWYVVPLCYTALANEPEARSIYWAVARFHDRDERADGYLAHRFVLSPDERPRWPHALCESSNPLLDGRSDRAVAAAHEELYGARAADIGARTKGLLAWSAFCKLDRREDEHPARAFAPVLSMARRAPAPNEYVRGPFAADITLCATLWQPSLEHGALANTSIPTEPKLPEGMGPGELARLAAASRTLPSTLPWPDALADDHARLLALCERLASGVLSEADRTYLRGPMVDYLRRTASSVLDEG